MKRIRKGDMIHKGDIILVKQRREERNGITKNDKLIVISEESRETVASDRIHIKMIYSSSRHIRNVFLDSNNRNKLCIWFTIDNYFLVNENEALVRMI